MDTSVSTNTPITSSSTDASAVEVINLPLEARKPKVMWGPKDFKDNNLCSVGNHTWKKEFTLPGEKARKFCVRCGEKKLARDRKW